MSEGQGAMAPPERAVDLSEDELEAFLHHYDLVVVDCWLDTCKHSRRMLPVFETVARDNSARAAFGRVDVRRHYHVPVKFEVKATPTILFFRRGRLVDSLVGEMSKEELEVAVRHQLDRLGDETAPI
ncbi:MAG: thioredoxin family protein [Methanomassiliicoccales archaeon]|jgi:thioredoxin-like negative regulator of GroEL|nr:thioredoxin family protein [Methanomassiliicoccales archaeon]